MPIRTFGRQFAGEIQAPVAIGAVKAKLERRYFL
jgi:hypothetical protein